jgi:hypothetical protein
LYQIVLPVPSPNWWHSISTFVPAGSIVTTLQSRLLVLGAAAAAAEPSGTGQFTQNISSVGVGRTHSSSAANAYCNGEKKGVMARKTVIAAMLMTSNWDLALVHPVVIIKQSIDKLNNNVLLQSRSRLNSLDSNHPSQPFCLQFSPDLNLEDPQPKFIHEQLAI